MRILPFFQTVALVFCGLMTGVLLGDRLGPTYARPALTPSSFITLQQVTHIHFGKVLPKFMAGALAGGLLWLILIRAQRSSIQFWLLAFAVAAITSSGGRYDTCELSDQRSTDGMECSIATRQFETDLEHLGEGSHHSHDALAKRFRS